jgi:hypothetical protein
VVKTSEGDAADSCPNGNLAKASDSHATAILLIMLHVKLN